MTDKEKLSMIKAFNASILKVESEIGELMSSILELDSKQYIVINNKSNEYIDELKQELLIYISTC